MSDAKSAGPMIPTPHILHFFLLMTALAALIYFLVARSIVHDARQTAETVGDKSMPSIVAAEEIRKAMADANTSAAKALLTTGDAANSARIRYEADLAIISDRLVAVAKNIKPAYADQEEQPILTMARGLPRYAAIVAQSYGPDALANVANLRAAVKFSQTEILPAAKALDDVNFQHLSFEYLSDKEDTTTKCAKVIGAGMLLLIVLVGIQLSLLARFHRLINLPLVGATVLLLVTCVWVVYALFAAQSALQFAKEDAFDPIHTLWKIRAAEYDADTDMALWLLDSSTADYEISFTNKSREMVRESLSSDTVNRIERDPRPSIDGLLGGPFKKNNFFPQERSTLSAMVRNHKIYVDSITGVREFERSSEHGKAVAQWLGDHEDQSSGALDRFDKSVANSLLLNNFQFASSVAQAKDQFSSFDFFLPASALMIAFLAWAGLKPRIKEYA